MQPAVPARVWLADDSAVEVEHTRTLLSRAAHQVETFSDGASLLERLEQPGVELPEVLLLDWLMPGITGLEVCRFLRDRYGPTDLPILVLTASTHEGALEEAFAAGANDYVAKPARAVELLARVRTLLQTRRDTEALRTRERDRARLLVEAEAERTRLTIVLSTLEEGVMLHDVRGVVSFSNAAAERLLGLTAEQLAGRTPADPHWGAVHEDGTPFPGEEHASMRALRTGQGIVGVTMGVRHADGRLVWLSINAQPYFEQDKRTLAGVVSSFADITVQVHARHRLESLAQQLRESEEHLRRVVESSGTGIWEMDTATETLVTDARFREMFGLSPDEPFPLEKGISIIHPEDRPRVARNLSAALAGDEGGRFRAEYRTVRGSDGRWRWVEARGHADIGPDGKPVRIFGTGVDITARKQMEAERELLLEALAAQPSLNVCVLRGPSFVFEMANAVYLEQIASGRDILGKPLFEALPELAGQGLDMHFARLLATGEPYVGREVPARFYRADGTQGEGFYHFVHQPIRSRDGGYDSILCMGQDVTGMVRARQEAERLMSLEKERASFEQQLIGIVSHDLRNPVAAIMMGASTLLRRPDMEERQRRTAERILTSAGRANRMIHDLLDFTQARLGGGIRVQRVPSDFHAILRQVVEECQVSTPGRALRLVQKGSGEGAWDGDRLAQLVSNLLSNAVHYSPPDSPVRIELHGDPNELVLTVHNSGAPIPPEVLPHLFQPMHRGVAQVSEVRSVGLGLYIVDQVVRAHGGRVEVTSTAEAGTTFTVRLPRAH